MLDAEPRRVAPREAAVLSEDRLDAVVVAPRVVAKIDGADVVVPVVPPAGQRAGLLPNVALRVAAPVRADREPRPQPAPVVVVVRLLGVVASGALDEHC